MDFLYLAPKQHLHLSVINEKPLRIHSSVCLTGKILLEKGAFPECIRRWGMAEQTKHIIIFPPLTSNSLLILFSLFFFLFSFYAFTSMSLSRSLSFIHLPSLQLGHPFSGRGNAAERLCLHPQRVWEPLRAGGGVRLPGVLHHLVPQQTGPETAVAGVPRY